jgi:tRNA A37 threonylcarbamoyladenosine biosynthesis protein TsaE
MIQKNKEIDISDDNIFLHDKLNRKDAIKDLSQLLVSTHEPFVLSINASWGAGKTTFVKLWKTYLEKELDVHSIYFSAWEWNDPYKLGSVRNSVLR